MKHRTGVGHLPEARAVSWGCTCGAAQLWSYAASTPAEWAMRLAARCADTHRTLAALNETERP